MKCARAARTRKSAALTRQEVFMKRALFVCVICVVSLCMPLIAGQIETPSSPNGKNAPVLKNVPSSKVSESVKTQLPSNLKTVTTAMAKSVLDKIEKNQINSYTAEKLMLTLTTGKGVSDKVKQYCVSRIIAMAGKTSWANENAQKGYYNISSVSRVLWQLVASKDKAISAKTKQQCLRIVADKIWGSSNHKAQITMLEAISYNSQVLKSMTTQQKTFFEGVLRGVATMEKDGRVRNCAIVVYKQLFPKNEI